MKIQSFIQAFERFAPLSLAEPWDKVGLQVGSRQAQVMRVMLAIDLTERVADEAVKKKAGLVLAYHPVIFEPLAELTDARAKTRAVLMLVKNDIAVFSPHTALDACEGGINDWLAWGVAGIGADQFEKRGVKCRPIKGAKAGDAGMCKVVVFVPAGDVERVRDAMAAAGAGRLGNYEKCSFETRGVGTFQGNEKANPAIGKAGVFERVEEVRLEMITVGGVLGDVVAAMRKAHPYEEPAFDVFKLEPAAAKPAPAKAGQGRVVELPRAVMVAQLAARVKAHLGVKALEVSAGALKRKARRIGVCAGAGASLMTDAGEIDLFLTGEMRHHDQLDAAGRGVAVMLAGHTQTERGYLRVLQGRFKALCPGVDVVVSRADAAPMVGV